MDSDGFSVFLAEKNNEKRLGLMKMLVMFSAFFMRWKYWKKFDAFYIQALQGYATW